jgi:hypothetical protein
MGMGAIGGGGTNCWTYGVGGYIGGAVGITGGGQTCGHGGGRHGLDATGGGANTGTDRAVGAGGGTLGIGRPQVF